MSKKTEAERVQFLAEIGLNPDAAALERQPATTPTASLDVRWAPDGIDPRTMPVTDIVFDPKMVEQFVDLNPRNRKMAANHLFEHYKAYGRNKDRNSLLNSKIGQFLARVHEERQVQAGGGFVKDKMRLANFLAEHNLGEDDLLELIALKEAQA